MKRSKSVALLLPLAITACAEEPPQPKLLNTVECINEQCRQSYAAHSFVHYPMFINTYPGYYSNAPAIAPPRAAPLVGIRTPSVVVARAPVFQPGASVPAAGVRAPMSVRAALTAPVARGGLGGFGRGISVAS